MRISDRHVVRALPLFRGMEEVHFAALMGAALLQSFPPHVVLIREGELPDFLHVLVEGAVELFAEHDGHETTIDTIVPTATFILAAAVRDEVYLKSARTLAPSRVLMIPASALREVFGRDAAFARAVVDELALRYRSVVRALKNQKLRSGAERLANWILRADTRAGATGMLQLTFEKRLLASLLGMTPENLSRSFATHSAHGVASNGRSVAIKDRAQLERFAKADPLIEDFAEAV